jgi:Fuc2NAc and GlcNAc transferase
MTTTLITALLTLVVATLLSAFGVSQIRTLALKTNMLDIPNERSSHERPTPRGGGLAVVIVILIGTLILWGGQALDGRFVGAMFAGGLVALIGYLDDRGDIAPLHRAGVHFAAAILGLWALGGMPPLEVGFATLQWAWVGHLIGVVGIVWMVNLFNFMDGIDGLAASEAAFIFGVGGVLLGLMQLTGPMLLAVLGLGAFLGFLWWNWPPAKIFMGDVASGFLGYMIAIVAIASTKQGFPSWVWLVLIGIFFIDATYTLIRRILQGERWYAPHRSHAYQHLTQFFGRHQPVTLLMLAINLLWLAPLGVGAYLHPQWGLIAVLVAWLPLLAAAVIVNRRIAQN